MSASNVRGNSQAGGKLTLDPTLQQLHRLVDAPHLLSAALDDLMDPTEVPAEDVAAGWRLALVTYRADPTRAVAGRILIEGRVG